MEALYERVGVIVEEFDGIDPVLVDDEEFEEYILELRECVANINPAPSHIIVHPDGRLELLFYPIAAKEFTEEELNSLAYDIEIAFSFEERLEVSIPEDIISNCKPALTEFEMYHFFIIGLLENTKNFKEDILTAKLMPTNTDAIEIKAAQ